MNRTLHHTLGFLLFAAALPAQAQDPEAFPGLLDVLTPESEAGTFIAGVCRGSCEVSFSPYSPLPPEGVGPARVVLTEPGNACSDLTNADDVKGNLALVHWRGPPPSSTSSGCALGVMESVEEAGGMGVIMYYNEGVASDDDETLMNIGWPPDVLTPFPAVFITRYRGGRLLAAIEAGEEVTAVMRMNPTVASEPEAEPKAVLGLSVWPNPGASPGIMLELERLEAVQLAVYDVLGREVAVLHDGLLGTGPHRFVAVGLPVGVYVVRAESAGQTATRRFTVLL